jgi:hypothetical protein
VKLLARLEANVFPWLGYRPIRDIKPPELLSVLRPVKSRGVLETAHRLMNYCGNIYRYSVATRRAERDISSDLRGALPPSQSPKGQFQIHSSLDLPHHLEINSAIYYVGSTTEASNNVNVPVAAYVRGDVGLLWKPGAAWSIGIWGKNLFAPRHVDYASESTNVVTEIPARLGIVTWSF